MSALTESIREQLSLATGAHQLLTQQGCIVTHIEINGGHPRMTLDEPPPQSAAALWARAVLRIECVNGTRRELCTAMFGGCIVQWPPRADLPPCVGARLRDHMAERFAAVEDAGR